MNVPTDRIHDIQWAYGRLWFPLGRGRWIGRFDDYGWRRTTAFHNCRATGVY